MRTLNDITPPSRRKEVDPLSQPIGSGPLRLNERPPTFPYATLIAVFLVIALSVGALFYFSSAKVEVTPNTVSAAVQSSFTANQSSGALPYEIITAQKVATQSVKSSGSKTVNSSASGNIIIYNKQTKSQRLITNTRFATTAGLIFRIHTAITIPGGSAANPGSITAKVYADQPGSTYNIAPTSFTIPGFAGTPQENLVYARSEVPMTGGASGTVPVLDSAVESQTESALIKALTPDLLAAIEEQVPEGYILVEGASSTFFEKLTPTSSGTTGQVDVKEQGTIIAVIFPNASLAKAVAESITGLDYQGEPLTLASASSLSLSAPRLPDASVSSFAFTLSGTASLIYTIDSTRIAAAVSGKTRSAAEVALTNYPEVKRAVITLRPFWRKTFPQDPSSINVSVANP
ncbi:hypothetical protein A2950_00770 [Candidatus Kaiserbacteria bacterium RIFCSPLOWO2_01_FULL_55_19]|uniref:Baseplate protein J-like domain-containing protein n=1 Tax=Candidatus Kaiserbacteria bacterium RIFCSPLOWO2_01_FULL_55_19 TaxID=1798516 RepID=A0A1F6ESB7_9BACT|nr:MAG: hypothetical protein A2950_00770 [Candidatus Kaiserbacteria bacterium RIFCSPLOWO2_01_FULL_55_19]